MIPGLWKITYPCYKNLPGNGMLCQYSYYYLWQDNETLPFKALPFFGLRVFMLPHIDIEGDDEQDAGKAIHRFFNEELKNL